MPNLNGKICKTARSLLKWNLRELSYHCGIKPDRIEMFERGVTHIYANEKNDLLKVFKKEGVIIKDNGEVQLEDAKRGKDDSYHGHHTATAHQEATVITDAEINALREGSTALEEEKRRVAEKKKKKLF